MDPIEDCFQLRLKTLVYTKLYLCHDLGICSPCLNSKSHLTRFHNPSFLCVKRLFWACVCQRGGECACGDVSPGCYAWNLGRKGPENSMLIYSVGILPNVFCSMNVLYLWHFLKEYIEELAMCFLSKFCVAPDAHCGQRGVKTDKLLHKIADSANVSIQKEKQEMNQKDQVILGRDFFFFFHILSFLGRGRELVMDWAIAMVRQLPVVMHCGIPSSR